MLYIATIFLIPVTLLFLPIATVIVFKETKHGFFVALMYAAAALAFLYGLMVFDNGFDAPDGAMGLRILVPYLLLSAPLAIVTIAVVGLKRHLKEKLSWHEAS